MSLKRDRMMKNGTLKPARQVASFEVQPKTPSGKPVGMPVSVDVEPKNKKKTKRIKKKHYATLSCMSCRDESGHDSGAIKEQYCPETKKFSKNFYRTFGDRMISGYATYDDGDKWDSWASLLCKYSPSIRIDIMAFLTYYKPLESEVKFIANRLEEKQLLIHEAEKKYFKALHSKRKRFKEYGPPSRRRSHSRIIKNKE